MENIKVELLRVAALVSADSDEVLKIAQKYYAWVNRVDKKRAPNTGTTEEPITLTDMQKNEVTEEDKTKNPNYYLSDEDRDFKIREMFFMDKTDQEMADTFNISRHKVGKIRSKLHLNRSRKPNPRARTMNNSFYAQANGRKRLAPPIGDDEADEIIGDYLSKNNPRELANVDHCVSWLRSQGHVILKATEEPLLYTIEDQRTTKNESALISWCNEKRDRRGLRPFLIGCPLPVEIPGIPSDLDLDI